MKPKILISREIFPETLALLARHFDVSDNQADEPLDAETFASRLADKDGVFVFSGDRMDSTLIARAPRLKVIANAAVGYNNIDLAAATARGILVTNTPGVLDETTADLTWALMFAAARRTFELEAFVRAGKWDRIRFIRDLGLDVHHATLGILGMGRIGQAVARRALGFRMRVIYSNRTRLAPQVEAACNASFVSQEELLRQADFVTLHMPYTPESHHLIGANEIALMKPTAILINAARGGIVDEPALIEALRARRIAAAAIDVFENEPKVRPEFFALTNVVVLPHVGSATDATRRKMATLAAENLIAALTGGNPANLVNPEAKTRTATP
jgi:glyoxylate/hydroxypyruvate/2-ketogluconate reductase